MTVDECCISDSTRITIDRWTDFIPFVSTATNIVNVVEQCFSSEETNVDPTQHYYSYLSTKEGFITFFLLIPVINIFAAIYFHCFASENSSDEARRALKLHEEKAEEKAEQKAALAKERLREAFASVSLDLKDIPKDLKQRTEEELDVYSPELSENQAIVQGESPDGYYLLIELTNKKTDENVVILIGKGPWGNWGQRNRGVQGVPKLLNGDDIAKTREDLEETSLDSLKAVLSGGSFVDPKTQDTFSLSEKSREQIGALLEASFANMVSEESL